MGIGFVLLLWSVIGIIVSVIALLFFRATTAFLTRGVTKGRHRAIVVAGLFPFACFAWAGFVFVFQALINESVLHRDPGLGDAWHCLLPNGYEILMIDVDDYGWVYNPKTQVNPDGVREQEDAIANVRLLQITGPYIFGGVDQKATEHLDGANDQIDSYFVLNAQTGKRTTLPNYDALRNTAFQLGTQLKLESIQTVYSRYRFSWFDLFVGLLFCVPMIISFLMLVRWIIQLRRTRILTAQPA
jgi:hypothetical protein